LRRWGHKSREKTEDIINKFLDCETRVVFTKDPSFIINAHSWPEDPSKKLVPPNPNQQNVPSVGP
jgi:hypothetical protein